MMRFFQTLWQRQRAFFPSVMILTLWRWRQQWLLLLVTGAGVLVATILIASLPLFSSVMTTAGLRSTLRSTPGSERLAATLSLRAISSQGVTQATNQLNSLAGKDLASYNNFQPGSAMQIRVSDWEVKNSNGIVNLNGVSMSEAMPHLHILQGNVPNGQNAGLGVMLTQSAATYLGAGIGSLLSLQTNITTSVPQGFGSSATVVKQTLQLHVVGIFSLEKDDLYWNGTDFQVQLPATQQSTLVNVLVSNSALLHFVDTLADQYKTRSLFFSNPCLISLTYTLNTAHITGDQLDDLTNRLGTFQADAAQQNVSGSNFHLFFPYISNVKLVGPVLAGSFSSSLLAKFQNQVVLSTISILLLTIQIICLILFFVSVTASTLLERQMGEIALLRSRGASSQQISGMLVLQSLGLCVFAAFLGPLLAQGIVAFWAPHFLTPLDQDALNALPQSFAQLYATVGLYILGAVLITLTTMIFSLVTALRFNTQAFKREMARSMRRPLWLRLRLDLVMAVLALASYGYSFSLQNTQQLLDSQAQGMFLTPLNLLAPCFFLLAGILFFLRLFPALLRLLARLSLNGRGLSSSLALARMERAPRQPMRMALLLGLATAFALFTLVFSASQAQHAQDLASYEAGADFSGYLSTTVQSANDVSQAALARETALYQHISGVTSASVGYVEQGFLQLNPNSPDQVTRPVQLRAVDSTTFAQTAYWSAQESSQTTNALMTQLAAQRSQAIAHDVVPAIVSSSAWQLLHLNTGKMFQLLDHAGQLDQVHYVAVVQAAHIPPANDSMESGVLVDFSTLAAVRVQNHDPIDLNYAWLRTSDAPADLAYVRQALSTQPLALSSLEDRRVLAEATSANPLVLNVLGILSIGVIAALLLALLANLLLPVLGLQTQLTSFAVLRALGTPPRQMIRLLAWEQGIVLLTALLLGLLFGLLLAFIAVPSLIITGIPVTNAAILDANTVYLLPHLIPTRVVFPFSLVLALGVLVLLCLLALALMLSLALRPALAQILRVSED